MYTAPHPWSPHADTGVTNIVLVTAVSGLSPATSHILTIVTIVTIVTIAQLNTVLATIGLDHLSLGLDLVMSAA